METKDVPEQADSVKLVQRSSQGDEEMARQKELEYHKKALD